MTCRSSTPSFMYWLASANTVCTMAFLMGVCAVTRMPSTIVFPLASLTFLPLSTGKSVLLTKPSSLSPVMALPDLSSCAQFAQRHTSGRIDT